MVLGTTLAVAGSTDCMAMLGGTVEIVYVQPGQTHIAFASSTSVTINVTLGVGAP
jgi:hypothetical protein